MAGYYKDTRQSPGLPNIRVTRTDVGRPSLNVIDALVSPSDYLIGDVEVNMKYPGYRDSVYSYRTNRSSSGILNSGKLLSDVPIIESLDNQVKPDTGHEFDSVKHTMVPWNRWRTYSFDYDVVTGNAGRMHYSGPIAHFGFLTSAGYLGMASQRNVDGASVFGPSIPDLAPSWGTKAIAKTQPTKSNASIATALIELRDGLPNMPGKALKNARGFTDLTKVGPDEFLNYVFGLVPALSDIRSLAVSIVNQKKILDQFQRDNDKVVRRRYGFPVQATQQTWTEQVVNAQWNILPGLGFNSATSRFDTEGLLQGQSHTAHRTLSKRDRIWFSGAFRYHLASTDSQWGRIERTSQLMAKLLGARLDAQSLWAAMPWSWLVDWFADVGDIIGNATHSILDGQLLQYGYVMCESTQNSTFTSDNLQFKNGLVMDNLTTAFVTQRKQRVKATPYGFGLNSDSFSAQQWAILGALGMTKSPKSLF